MTISIEMVDDQAVAFAGFVYNIVGLSRHPWTKRGPLADVPDEIIAEAATLNSLYRLSFTKDPLVEARDMGLPQAHQLFIRKLRPLHEELWLTYQSSMEFTKECMLQLISVYGAILPGKISGQTGSDWEYDRVNLVPALYAGGTVTGSSVFLGFRGGQRSIETTWPIAIHELVHVNTNPTKNRLRDHIHLLTDTNEVVTVLMTNRVISLLNEESSGNLPFNQYSYYYNEFIKQWHDDFAAIEGRKMDYRETLLAVDEFFAQHDYNGYFKGYGI